MPTVAYGLTIYGVVIGITVPCANNAISKLCISVSHWQWCWTSL